jgi:UDP-N-acetylmuramoyl-tripeptide--D-alanyl-D-alanine ligase
VNLTGEGVAGGSGAEVRARGAEGSPKRVVIDSRGVRQGDLFVGLIGERFDGGEFGVRALEAGAWGVLIGNQWAQEIAAARESGVETPDGWVFGALDPLASLQSLARAWRRELGAKVVGITGSTGKTSVKDACAALLPLRVH